jgi:hypothetical protein
LRCRAVFGLLFESRFLGCTFLSLGIFFGHPGRNACFLLCLELGQGCCNSIVDGLLSPGVLR